MIKINYLNTKEVSTKLKKQINEIFDYTLGELGQTADFEINFAYVSANDIKEMNKRARGVDKETDVLSFPAFDLSINEVVDLKDTKYSLNINPEDDAFMLGDIIICKEVAEIQAKNLEHTFDDEIVRLSLHSLLHCLGYDHIKDSDYFDMHEVEKNSLEKFGYNAD